MNENEFESLKRHSKITQNDAGESTSATTEEILKERGDRYGHFKDHAEISNALRATFMNHYIKTHSNGEQIPPYMMESIIMICHKLGRIANGDPYYDDSWKDIAGYAQLVVDILHGKNT